MHADERPPNAAWSSEAVQQNGSARTVLLRILGDLVHPEAEPVPTRALLRVLEDLGFGEHAARQAITRCVRIGVVAGRKSGRNREWLLTPVGHDLMADGDARARQLGTDPPSWNRRWLAVFLSIPHERRAVRQKLYRALAWAGCGMAEPGLWISAHPERTEVVRHALERAGLGRTAISFVGEAGLVGQSDLELVDKAWDLDEVAAGYRNALNGFDVTSPSASGSDAVRLLTQVDAVLQEMVSQDPWLPVELAPGWGGRRHAAALLSYRDELLVPARAHWISILDS